MTASPAAGGAIVGPVDPLLSQDTKIRDLSRESARDHHTLQGLVETQRRAASRHTLTPSKAEITIQPGLPPPPPPDQ